MKNRFKILFIIIFSLLSSNGFAEIKPDAVKIIATHIKNKSIENGKHARSFYEIDFSSDFDKYLKKAESGDAEAQYHVGQMYVRSRKLNISYKKSAFWLEKAANQGHMLAQFHISELYEIGTGIPKDQKKSSDFLKLAAKQDHARAQSFLSMAYARGNTIIDIDAERAFYWAQKSANQNDIIGLGLISSMYLRGMGVEKNIELGVEWAEKGALNGQADSYQNLGIFFNYGKGDDKNLVQAYKYYLIHEAILKAKNTTHNITNTQNLLTSLSGKMTNKEVEQANKLTEQWFLNTASKIQ